ncbi:hypothetical protein [Desulfosporosinus sp. SB140]|uniref:hypothetical protein n=1 Tax=Desulfosporosinus paludis TaxID=3115649 RepID=UPI00388D5DD1
MSNNRYQVGFVDRDDEGLTKIYAKGVVTLKAAADLKAAATDYQNFGTLLTPQFEREIKDIARRRGVFGQLIEQQQTPAVGHPHRWYEQYVLPNTGGFTDPRNITPTAANNGSSLRTENAANVRALTGQINFGLFDQQTAAQTSIFPQLVAKDLKDMITAIYQAADLAYFTGAATSLTDGSSVQYCSLKTQITNTIQVNPGASIIDAIRTKIATLMASQVVVVRPTHIFMNPLLVDILEQEIKNAVNTMKQVPAGETEVVPGIIVPAIRTAAGIIPVIPAWEMATRVSSVQGASTDYPLMICSMDLMEQGWIGMPEIQIYKLGLVSDLADKYVAVIFNTGAIVKGASYAHSYGYVSR